MRVVRVVRVLRVGCARVRCAVSVLWSGDVGGCSGRACAARHGVARPGSAAGRRMSAAHVRERGVQREGGRETRRALFPELGVEGRVLIQ